MEELEAELFCNQCDELTPAQDRDEGTIRDRLRPEWEAYEAAVCSCCGRHYAMSDTVKEAMLSDDPELLKEAVRLLSLALCSYHCDVESAAAAARFKEFKEGRKG